MDELGLDRLDRSVLDAMCRRFGGGPVGLSTLAIAVGEERETVEEVAEPFLVRQGFLMRTQRPGCDACCLAPPAWHLPIPQLASRSHLTSFLTGAAGQAGCRCAVRCRFSSQTR